MRFLWKAKGFEQGVLGRPNPYGIYGRVARDSERTGSRNRGSLPTSRLLSGFAGFEFLGKNTSNIPPLAIHSVSNGEKAVEALVI
jgi:hypothetical protein